MNAPIRRRYSAGAMASKSSWSAPGTIQNSFAATMGSKTSRASSGRVRVSRSPLSTKTGNRNEAAPSRGRRPTKVLAGAERYEDAVGALVTLGYTQAQAAETVRRVSEDGGDPSAEALLRRSLVLLRPARVSR